MKPRRRPDLDAIDEQVARERAAAQRPAVVAGETRERRERQVRELEHAIDFPCSPTLEGRLLAAMVCDPAVLALCEDVDSEYFHKLWHLEVFMTLRALQAAGAFQVGEVFTVYDAIAAVGDYLEARDAFLEKNVRSSVDDAFLAELLARHMHETYGPFGAPIAAWVLHDVAQLRELARARRELREAATIREQERRRALRQEAPPL